MTVFTEDGLLELKRAGRALGRVTRSLVLMASSGCFAGRPTDRTRPLPNAEYGCGNMIIARRCKLNRTIWGGGAEVNRVGGMWVGVYAIV